MGEVNKRTREKVQDKMLTISIEEETTETLDNNQKEQSGTEGGRNADKLTLVKLEAPWLIPTPLSFLMGC